MFDKTRTFNLSSFPNQQYKKIWDSMQAVYRTIIKRLELRDVVASLYKLAHTTSMLTAN